MPDRAGGSSGGCGAAVGLFGSQHGVEDVAAAAGQADQGGVVFLAFGAFAVVVAAGGSRVARRRPRGTVPV